MRDFFHWMKGRGFWKKSRGAHRSIRRSAIVWGSAFALVTGCVASWGVTSPTGPDETGGSSASQDKDNGHGNASGDKDWNDGPRGDDEVAGDSDAEDTTDGTPDDGTPDGATDDGTKDGESGTDNDSTDKDSTDNDNAGEGNKDEGSKDEGSKDDTPAPSTPAPSKPAPSKPAPSKPAPSKPAPTKPAPAPSTPAGSWPTAETTGVPAGVSLTQMNGLTVKADNTVIDGKLVKGDIVINANNVTIKNSKVEGRIQIRPPYKGLMVQSTEIAGPGTAWAAVTEGIGYANFTCDRCDIHGWGKGAMMDANVTISNSWIHDMPVAAGSHNEAILSLGGYNYNILNNRLDSGRAGNFTASLAFLNQWNSFKDTLVKGNLFNGGGYCVYAGGEKAHNNARPSSNVRFIDNTFGTDHNSKCGYYGAAIAWHAGGPGNQWSGNVMANGDVVRAPSAG